MIKLYEHLIHRLCHRVTRWWNNNIVTNDPIYDFEDMLADWLDGGDRDEFIQYWQGRVPDEDIKRASRLFEQRDLGI